MTLDKTEMEHTNTRTTKKEQHTHTRYRQKYKNPTNKNCLDKM